MNSELFKLGTNDFIKGLVSAIVAAFVITLYGVVTQAGFNLFTADWGVILNSSLNAGIAAFIGYLGKNFLSDKDGKVLGAI